MIVKHKIKNFPRWKKRFMFSDKKQNQRRKKKIISFIQRLFSSLSRLVLDRDSIPLWCRIENHQIFIRKHTAKIYKVKIHSTVKSSFENTKKGICAKERRDLRGTFMFFEGNETTHLFVSWNANFFDNASLYHFCFLGKIWRWEYKTSWITMEMLDISSLFPHTNCCISK